MDLLAVVAFMGILAAMTVPITEATLRSHRLRGDAASVKHLVGLAKSRASSAFTRARVRVDLMTNTYVLQVWDKTAAAWIDERSPLQTSTGVSFGFRDLATPPPNTQVAIALSPPCTIGVTADDPIPDTACVIFNSRGLPVDSGGALFAAHALYLTGEMGVYAVTVTATPLIRSWWSPPGGAAWVER